MRKEQETEGGVLIVFNKKVWKFIQRNNLAVYEKWVFLFSDEVHWYSGAQSHFSATMAYEEGWAEALIFLAQALTF